MLTPDDTVAGTASWSRVLTTPGRHSFSYSIIHGQSDELRRLQCTASSMVDAAGLLLQVFATHVDVTDAVAASIRAELEHVAASEERSRLLRQVGDMLATSRLGLDELLRTIVDLACTTVGEGAAIRILSADQRAIELDVTAHPDESVRLRLAASLQRSARDPVPIDGIVAEVVQKGKLLSDFRQRDWSPGVSEDLHRAGVRSGRTHDCRPGPAQRDGTGQAGGFQDEPERALPGRRRRCVAGVGGRRRRRDRGEPKPG